MTQKNSHLNFESEPIKVLFRKIFFPTLLGLFFGVLLNVADGIFVGRGVGSDALAAVNIAAPIFLIMSGVAMLLGSGASVVMAIHLGKGNIQAARINMTLALVVAFLLQLIFVSVFCIFAEQTCYLFGGSDRLMDLFKDYLFGIAAGTVVFPLAMVGTFVIRLDGSPKLASSIQITGCVLNIFLDWLFVFPLGLGIAGAAWATAIACIVETLITITYLAFFSKTLKPCALSLDASSIISYIRNVFNMAKLGFSTFLGEMAITGIMITGNYGFMEMLGEDGVAAFSVACYLLPMVFMIGQAIVQSAQPIISFNYGQHQWERIAQTRTLAFTLALVLGFLLMIVGIFFTPFIASLFLAPCPAYDIACQGLPLFSIVFLFFTLCIVTIGYYQSLEFAKQATLFTLLRGFLFVIPAFILLPHWLGVNGLWLAMPISEILTLIVMFIFYQLKKDPAKKLQEKTIS